MENGVIFQSMTRDDLRNDIKEILSEVLNEKKGDVFLSRKEVRDKLKISYPTLDSAIEKGELIAYRIRGRILMKESEISLSRFTKTKG